MTMDMKGEMISVNAGGAAPLKVCLENCSAQIMSVQEHQTTKEDLPTFQRHVKGLGHHGTYEGANKTVYDGKSGG
eukprot:8051828-Pyramimonas_sp.AAC.1